MLVGWYTRVIAPETCTQGHVISEIKNLTSAAEAFGLQPSCSSLSTRFVSFSSVSLFFKPAAVLELSHHKFLISARL